MSSCPSVFRSVWVFFFLKLQLLSFTVIYSCTATELIHDKVWSLLTFKICQSFKKHIKGKQLANIGYYFLTLLCDTEVINVPHWILSRYSSLLPNPKMCLLESVILLNCLCVWMAVYLSAADYQSVRARPGYTILATELDIVQFLRHCPKFIHE